MKVFVSLDLEGATGVASSRQLRAGGSGLAAARAALRADLTAALEGCAAAGAGAVTVRDGHGRSDDLDVGGLGDGVTLALGANAPLGMMAGLDESFDAVLLVGYHAMAGTHAAVLDHTFASQVFRVRVDDADEAGEIGLNAALAGSFGVPVVFVSGDDKACAEARELLSGVETATVKEGLARDSARLFAPAAARACIREGVERALTAAQRPPALSWDERALRIVFTRSDFCDRAAECPRVERVDARTVRIDRPAFRDTYATLMACLRLATSGG